MAPEAALTPPASPELAGAVFTALLALIERGGSQGRPPVLALQGPVGAGKSTLVRALAELAAGRGLRLAVASIDDAYYPLARRRERLAGNPFGVSRVPPGSHDVPLLVERLAAWRAGGPLRLPRFDKALAGGEGERIADTEQPADALVLEGWLMGCRALGPELLAQRLPACRRHWPLSDEECRWLPHWDQELEVYQALWAACDGLWLLRPLRWTLPRRWRFQAEARQRRGGGGVLSPEALDRLVRASLHALPPALYMDPLLPEVLLPGQSQRGGDSIARAESAWPRSARSDQEATSPGSSGGRLAHGLPVLGVSCLDGRRRVVPPGDQSSLSSASSAIG